MLLSVTKPFQTLDVLSPCRVLHIIIIIELLSEIEEIEPDPPEGDDSSSDSMAQKHKGYDQL